MSEAIKNVEELDLNDILPNRFQPRIKFNEEKIFELAQSIKEHGVLQPIIVRPIGDKYEIVTGERRYKASVLAGLKTIPSIVLKLEDKDSIELALIENVQREDLSPIEEAISYKKILDMGYLTQDELADKLGISQSAIANKKRLLNLCDEVQEALMEKEISERHARSLLKITNLEVQKDLLYRIISEKLTVRQLDVEITKVLENPDYINKEPQNEEIEEENKIELTEEIPTNNNNSNSDDSTENSEDNSQEINFDDVLSEVVSFNDDKKEEEESIVVNNVELEKDTNTNDSNISLIESKQENNELNDKEENRENDTMNNMLNLNEDMNYNSLKNSSNTSGGKFIGISIDEDEKEEEKQPVVENKSFFDFSTGTVRENDENNNSAVTRNKNYEEEIESSNNNDIFGKKMSDLLSPQGTSTSINNDNSNQNIIFGATTEEKPVFEQTNNVEGQKEEPSSIFANLMKKEESSTNNIDNDALQSFLDPSFINGKKEESNIIGDNQINDSIFDKFIDEDFGGEISTPAASDSNDLLASTLFGNNQSEMINETNNSANLPELSNEVPSNLETPTESVENTQSIFENTPSIKVDSDKLDLNDLSNSTSQTELIPGLMASSNKPDLLAPMGGNTKSEEEKTSNSIFGLNTNDTTENSNNEQLEEEKTVDNESNSISINDNLDNNDLTPDSSVEVEEESEPTTISETIEHPVFITASNDDIDMSAPTTPIITDTKMSNLLSVEKNEEHTEENASEEVSTEENKIEETPEENVNENNEEETPITNNNIDIQPIIITDYNKQYDPILPQVEEDKGPQIDFKHILKLIRDLSSQIENYGYKIDTDEIDLDSTYQVIFNIDKK